jgi:hypothetical protein
MQKSRKMKTGIVLAGLVRGRASDGQFAPLVGAELLREGEYLWFIGSHIDGRKLL